MAGAPAGAPAMADAPAPAGAAASAGALERAGVVLGVLSGVVRLALDAYLAGGLVSLAAPAMTALAPAALLLLLAWRRPRLRFEARAVELVAALAALAVLYLGVRLVAIGGPPLIGWPPASAALLAVTALTVPLAGRGGRSWPDPVVLVVAAVLADGLASVSLPHQAGGIDGFLWLGAARDHLPGFLLAPFLGLVVAAGYLAIRDRLGQVAAAIPRLARLGLLPRRWGVTDPVSGGSASGRNVAVAAALAIAGGLYVTDALGLALIGVATLLLVAAAARARG
jgi:hypothetical protein